MPTLRELLNRFRPAGTPGAPGGAAVPADRAAELAAELAPVFEALRDTLAEADAIRSESVRRAATHRAESAATAARILADAHRTTDSERAAGYATARAGGEAAAAALIEDGRRAAESVERRVGTRMPGLVSDVVVAALAEVDLSHEPASGPRSAAPARANRDGAS
jgi:hypothetical protein